MKGTNLSQFLVRWINLEPVIESGQVREKIDIVYINARIWNLEKWY